MKNVLYEEDRNRYLIKSQLRLVPTTLIMGAKCNDGVVLVGDRKVTSGLGTSYMDKIRVSGQMNGIIFGAAGIGTLFEEFLTLIEPKVQNHIQRIDYQNQKLLNQHKQDFSNDAIAKQPPLMKYTEEEFKQDCVELLTEMRMRYTVAFQDPNFLVEIFIGYNSNLGSRLYYIDSKYCVPAAVNGVVFIGVSQLAEIFRKSSNDNMSMKQSAKLGMLAIKYIQQEKMSEVIGVDGGEQPQVWFIPNQQLPKPITGAELTDLANDVDAKVASLRSLMHSLFGS